MRYGLRPWSLWLRYGLPHLQTVPKHERSLRNLRNDHLSKHATAPTISDQRQEKARLRGLSQASAENERWPRCQQAIDRSIPT